MQRFLHGPPFNSQMQRDGRNARSPPIAHRDIKAENVRGCSSHISSSFRFVAEPRSGGASRKARLRRSAVFLSSFRFENLSRGNHFEASALRATLCLVETRLKVVFTLGKRRRYCRSRALRFLACVMSYFSKADTPLRAFSGPPQQSREFRLARLRKPHVPLLKLIESGFLECFVYISDGCFKNVLFSWKHMTLPKMHTHCILQFIHFIAHELPTIHCTTPRCLVGTGN